MCGVRDLIDCAVECRFVCLRRLAEAAQFANELERRSADFVRRGRRFKIMQGFNVSAHAGTVQALWRTRQREILREARLQPVRALSRPERSAEYHHAMVQMSAVFVFSVSNPIIQAFGVAPFPRWSGAENGQHCCRRCRAFDLRLETAPFESYQSLSGLSWAISSGRSPT